MNQDHIVKMKIVVKEKGLNMVELAAIFNKAPSTINNYLSGKTDMPLNFFMEFCDYFKIPYLHMLSSGSETQILRINLDNAMVENKLRSEISDLKDVIIKLQTNAYGSYTSQKKQSSGQS